MSLPSTPIGLDPDSELGRLGFLYSTNPLQHSVSGTAVLGAVKWGGAIFGNSAFGTIRTSDPHPEVAAGGLRTSETG